MYNQVSHFSLLILADCYLWENQSPHFCIRHAGIRPLRYDMNSDLRESVETLLFPPHMNILPSIEIYIRTTTSVWLNTVGITAEPTRPELPALDGAKSAELSYITPCNLFLRSPADLCQRHSQQ